MIEVAYEGRLRCVVWVRSVGGTYQGKDYFEGLPDRERAQFEVLFERLGDFGRITDTGKYHNEGDGLWCFKTRSGHRLVTFHDRRLVAITHGFFKRADRFTDQERRRALAIRDGYFKDINETGRTE